MTKDADNLVLEHLRHIRGKVDGNGERLDAIDRRLLSIETHLAAFHNSATHQEHELAALKSRVDRLERRLNLTDEQQ